MLDLKKLEAGRKKLNAPYRPMVHSTREPLDVELETVYGKIPDDITGHVFINSSSGTVNSAYPYPEKHPDGSHNQEYGSPLIMGGGYMMRLDFDKKDKVSFKSRLLKPPAYYADDALKYGNDTPFPEWAHSLTSFKNLGVSRMSFWLGFYDLLCTAVTPIRYGNDTEDRLLATNDVGRPYEFDPDTLELRTPIGWMTEYLNGVPGVLPWPFPVLQTTAHPTFDPLTKELYSVNYSKGSSKHLKESRLWNVLHLHHHSVEKELEKKVEEWSHINDSKDAQEKLNQYFGSLHKNYETPANKSSKRKHRLRRALHRLFGKLSHLIGIPKNEFSVENEVQLHKFDGGKVLDTWRLVDEKGEDIGITQCCHQTSISEDYFIFIDAAFKVSLDLMYNNPFPHNYKIDSFIRKHTTNPQEPYTDLYIVSRKDLVPGNKKVLAKRLRLKPEFVHCQLNYRNPNGKLTLFTASNSAACLAEWVRPFDQLLNGDEVDKDTLGIIAAGSMDIGRMCKYEIDAETATIASENILNSPGDLSSLNDMGPHTWSVGLYTFRDIYSGTVPSENITDIYFQCSGLEYKRLTQFVFDLYKDYPNQIISPEEIKKLSKKGVPSQLTRLNTETFQLEDYFQFPEGYEIRSLQFTPRDQPKGDRPGTDGYITTATLNEATVDGKTNFLREFWIFDAANLKQGPVCVLSHKDLDYAFTLHSVWKANLKSNRDNSYNIPVREDFDQMIDKIWLDKKKVKGFFEKEVYPHFE